MGMDYLNPAESFAEVIANRRVSYCQKGRTPTNWTVASPALPIQARAATLHDPTPAQEIISRAAASRLSPPAASRFARTVLIQSP
jgi:hypothetical protein